MREAIETAKKARRADRRCCSRRERHGERGLCARYPPLERAKRRALIAINCVGLSKELLESELFGHEKGAFTGAHQLKKGKMELANGGTLFLDKSAIYRPSCKQNFCGFSKSGSSSASAALSRFASTSE